LVFFLELFEFCAGLLAVAVVLVVVVLVEGCHVGGGFIVVFVLLFWVV